MLDTRRTCSLRVAGALMSMGATLMESTKGSDERIVFMLETPVNLDAETVVKLCHDGGHGLKVDLGAYETARNALRDEIDRHNGGSHGRRRT